jgi:hypothetical protein
VTGRPGAELSPADPLMALLAPFAIHDVYNHNPTRLSIPENPSGGVFLVSRDGEPCSQGVPDAAGTGTPIEQGRAFKWQKGCVMAGTPTARA